MSFDIYKRGQGYYTRMYSALMLFVIVAFGCYALYEKLRGTNIWVETLIPAGLCVVLGFLIYWLMNKPNFADFLIAAEGEIKKVSWSSRKEITISTFIVIFVVASMTLMLFTADFVFKYLFMEVLGI
jgi:preprotein translocase subunit SecE